jgi:tetratricopeptide (TPR) repeat protein
MLLSTEPNSILIVNGDNDTFPVWFMQEVEGVRTDVRVINSALAGSHWHILPLFNRVYDSDPVNFTLRPEHYRQGTNESIFIQDRNIGRRELMELIRFVGNDSPSTQVTLRGGGAANFLPSIQYLLTIDRDDLLARGIITEEQHPFTVQQMQHDIVPMWERISRADLAFLDILATNNWERPIYVASPHQQRNVWPIQQFAQMEGVVHRFVPFHNPNRNRTDAGLNGIATDKTYDLFMNQFTWGNLNDPKARVGPESRRSAQQHRTQFVYLAQALIAEGKMDSAVRVLDRGLEVFPHHKVDFDMPVILYIQAYFRVGESEKALALANQIVDIYEVNLRYFERFPPKHRRFAERFVQQAIQLFGFLRHSMLQGFEEEGKELFERLDNLLQPRGITHG